MRRHIEQVTLSGDNTLALAFKNEITNTIHEICLDEQQEKALWIFIRDYLYKDKPILANAIPLQGIVIDRITNHPKQ